MSAVHKLITDHLDIWTAADTEKKSGRGRASGNANSVYGIKKLRELILELAVRGKLVPQDANDEPAGELLKRIETEQAKLIAEGQIKKRKLCVPVSDQEKSFELAPGWEWVRVGQVGHDWGQKAPDGNFTYIEVSAIDSVRGVVSSPEQVRPEDAPSRARKIVKPGTIIYSTIRPYLLNIAVIEEDFSPEPIASTAFAIVHPFCAMPSRYFLYFFRSPEFVRYVESVQMGIAYPAINDGQFFSGVLPLPPIEEQHRIVAKVDELMALCDQLEAQHNNAADAHEQLVSHLLSTLTQSQDAADFNANWQRIATHFDTLFTTESSIDTLKQTLLQLAVMGKLVPQDPNDEPASELLKRIQDEKAKLVAEGKIKKEKHSEAVSIGRPRFPIPSTWEWVPMSELCRPISSGSTPSAESFNFDDGVPFLKVYNIRDQEIDFEYKKQFISESLNVSKLSRSILYPGDVVMNIVGPPLGKVAIIPNTYPKWNCNQALVFFGLIKPISNKYILNYLKEGSFLKDIELIGTAGQDNISVTKSKNILVPLPPVEEQLRIVKKTDELLSVCAQLSLKIKLAQKISRIVADSISNKF